MPRYFRFIALLFLFFFAGKNILFSQDQQLIDSLTRAISVQKDDTIKVSMLNKLAWEISYINLLDGQKIVSKGMLLADKLNYPRGKAELKNTLGTIYWDMGDHDQAIHEFLEAIDICEEIKYEAMIGILYSNIGGVFNAQKEYGSAIKYYHKSIDYLTKHNKKHNLKLVYMNTGSAYYDQKVPDSAMKYYNKALGLADTANYNLSDASLFLNFAAVHFENKNLDSALYYNSKAETIIEKENSDYYRVTLYIDKGAFLWAKSRSPESIGYYNKALILAKNIGYRQKLKSVYYGLSEIYESKSDFREALKYYKLFYAESDSLLNEEKNKQMKLFEARFQNEKNEKEIESQKQQNELLSKNNKLLELETEKQQHDNEKNKIILWFVSGMVLLFMILSFLMFKRYRDKKKTNEELSLQKTIIQEKNNEITSSIRYAQRIQKTVLSSDENLKKYFPEHFILFKPKDIVSGDFYWTTEKNAGGSGSGSSQDNSFYLALCDSTGHGVPGAFMSLLNTSFLNEAINQKNISSPDEVFNYVRNKLIENVSQEGARDGMDGVLLKVEGLKLKVNTEDKQLLTFNLQLSFAAANNSPVIIRNKEIIELPHDKMPVGMSHTKNDFKLSTFNLQPSDMLYLFTDGYADQFGSEENSTKPTGKKFKKNNLKKLLAEISMRPVNEQMEKLENTFNNWKGDFEQIDDVCVIGIRI